MTAASPSPLLRAVLIAFGLVFIFEIFILNRLRPSGWVAALAGDLHRLARVLALAGLLLAGCASEGPTDPGEGTGRAFTVQAGRQLEIRLQSIGPGEYLAPPSISSTVIRFVDVREATPHVPAGVTQLFRFQAVTPGRALVMFRHSEQSATVVDTVDVQ